MNEECNYSFFTAYGKYFTPILPKKNSPLPFKDHSQLQMTIDILSRKDCHHVILCSDYSAKINFAFLEGLSHSLSLPTVPRHLANSDLIYLDIESMPHDKNHSKDLENDFKNLRQTLETTDKCLIFVLSSLTPFKNTKKIANEFLYSQLKLFLSYPKCRFLVLAKNNDFLKHQEKLKNFYYLKISQPTDTEILAVLKQQSSELENFHHVSIPDELLPYAYSLAERYLSTNETLDKTLLLIDSCAARIASEKLDNQNQSKPTVTIATLLNVLASWIKIPETHLQAQFKLNEFTQAMQQRIFGQEAAITILAHEIQQAQIQLQLKTSPSSGFLFIGPKHSGKKSTAFALVEQLYDQLNVLYCTEHSSTVDDFSKIKLKHYVDNNYCELKDVITQMPYAVFLFENIEQAPAPILDGLREILTTGYLHDEKGKRYNFRQSIIILTTTHGSQRFSELTQNSSSNDESHDIDLMQLVMSDQKPTTFTGQRLRSPQELIDAIMPEINHYLLPALCENISIVPFLALTKSSIEKIMRLKLKLLCKQLDVRYGIELGFAPEVIRYLTDKVLQKQTNSDIDKVVKQLYFCVEQTILSQAGNKNRPNQLFLQLNETGHLLRCDWLGLVAVHE